MTTSTTPRRNRAIRVLMLVLGIVAGIAFTPILILQLFADAKGERR